MGSQLVIIERRQLIGQSLATVLHLRRIFQKIVLVRSAEEAIYEAGLIDNPVFLISVGSFDHGVNTIRMVRSYFQKSPIVILEDRLRPSGGLMAQQESAQGYWTLDDSLQDFHNGLDSVVRSAMSISPGASEMFVHTNSGLRLSDNQMKHPLYQLTRRELEMLQLFGRGAKNIECAEKMRITQKTVDNMKTKIMRKLNVNRTIDLVLFANRHGLVAN